MFNKKNIIMHLVIGLISGVIFYFISGKLLEYITFIVITFSSVLSFLFVWLYNSYNSYIRNHVSEQYLQDAMEQAVVRLTHDLRNSCDETKKILSVYEGLRHNPIQQNEIKKHLENSMDQIHFMLSSLHIFSSRVMVDLKRESLNDMVQSAVQNEFPSDSFPQLEVSYQFNHQDCPLVDVNLTQKALQYIFKSVKDVFDTQSTSVTHLNISSSEEKYKSYSTVTLTISSPTITFSRYDIPSLIDFVDEQYLLNKATWGFIYAKRAIDLQNGNLKFDQGTNNNGFQVQLSFISSHIRENTLDFNIRSTNSMSLDASSEETSIPLALSVYLQEDFLKSGCFA